MAGFLKREAVLCAAVLAAVLSAFLVPPSAAYMEYIDFRVLALLLGLMLTVSGAKKAGVFRFAAGRLLHGSASARSLAWKLSALCFFSSMLVTNDVALITLVPLALMTLPGGGPVQMRTVILMTMAANLGSMLTPLGNPQNLYLYTAFNLPLGRFLFTMLPPTLLSALLLALAGLTVPKDPLAAQAEDAVYLEAKKLLPWAGLFLVCIACVVRLLDYRLMLAVVLLAVLLLDRRLLLEADYSLLGTFVAFFVFVGNVRQLPSVSALLGQLVAGRELAAGVLLSQVISNVPAAVLLAGFCGDPLALLVGVNLGGLGTPIASMASLISYKQYARQREARRGRYLAAFLGWNFLLLAVLWLVFGLVR